VTHGDYLARSRFGSLDGLRAISVIAVIWHHTAPPWAAGTPLIYAGAEGVTLFFAISGFLITTLLLRERARTERIDLRAFYIRRAFRIMPLYYAVLLAYVGAVALFEANTQAGRDFFHNVRYYATFTSNLFVAFHGTVIFYFAWSVATEEQFYLMWPPLLRRIESLGRCGAVLLAAVLLLIADQLFAGSMLRLIPVAIVAGAGLAVALQAPAGYAALVPVLGRRWSSPLCAAALAVALAAPGVPPFVTHLLCVALVGACALREDHGLAPLLTLRALVYAGTISYGMYLLHMLCKNLVTRTLAGAGLPLEGIGVFALTVCVTVMAAGLSFRYFESPFLALKARYAR
jgi:peptidoglycan/LPS O-acetylase OafA/YrhL